MINIKNKVAISKMVQAGILLSDLFEELHEYIVPGITTWDIDQHIDNMLVKKGLVSQTKGYKGYKHSSCISVDDVVVHGVPDKRVVLKDGSLVKVDVCAAWNGYCADMARPFIVGNVNDSVKRFIEVARQALDKGIEKARVGNRISDISSAIQKEIEAYGFGVVRDFAGHGIGKRMHEDPEILNYGVPGKGPLLQHGMTFALEPMITMGHYDVYVDNDNWTVKTVDGSLAMHIEDTIAILQDGPKILTRYTHNV